MSYTQLTLHERYGHELVARTRSVRSCMDTFDRYNHRAHLNYSETTVLPMWHCKTPLVSSNTTLQDPSLFKLVQFETAYYRAQIRLLLALVDRYCSSSKQLKHHPRPT